MHTRTQDYEVYSIEVAKGYGAHEWREDLKRVLMKCGLDGKELVFLFTDTQIVQVGALDYWSQIPGAFK